MCVYALRLVSTLKMARRNVVIPDELDAQFRKAIASRMGIEKGNISEAICEAIRLWIKTKG